MNFCLDIETLGKSTESIVLSAAIVYFDLTEEVSYEELLSRTLFVKFSVNEQHAAGRTMNKDTLNWWARQSPEVRHFSFAPSPADVSLVEGLNRINNYVTEHRDKSEMCWTRGNFDQLILDSLYSSSNIKPAIHFNHYMDIRTALRLIKNTTNSVGYCKVPNFDVSKVMKHNPAHDICWDVLQIIQGE